MAEPQTQPQTVVAGQQPVGVREQSAAASNALPIPAPRPPRRNPNLTRADMAKVIRDGGAVIHKGEVIAHESHLPTEEDLAAGDAEKMAEVAAAHEANIAFSQAKLRQLKAAPTAAAGAKEDADAKAKAEADAKSKAAGGK